MIKKITIIFTFVILLILVFKLTFTSAQKYGKDSDSFSKDDMVTLEEKIDKMVNVLPEKGTQEKSSREINAKLDQIISNQQKILAELEVVKVRATKK